MSILMPNIGELQQTSLDYIAHGGLPKETSHVRNLWHKCHNIIK